MARQEWEIELRVWIDQSKCQNSGLCEEEAPALFKIGDDFFGYVRQGDSVLDDPGGESSQAEVAEHLEELAQACADACPARCIHVID